MSRRRAGVHLLRTGITSLTFRRNNVTNAALWGGAGSPIMRRMKLSVLSALLALPLAGCTLYFDADSSSGGPVTSPGGPGKHPSPEPDPTDPPKSCGPKEVHVFGVYESNGNHSVTGQASVAIERPGEHVLVLSSYEATSWHVTLGPNTKISAVQLIGYEDQTVDVPNVPITHASGCGYSYPYNGGGCDTNELIATAEAAAGAPLTTFHGCYQASLWALHADGHADSNCNTNAGYQVDEVIAKCDDDDGGGGSGDWEPGSFDTLEPPACTGERFVRYDAHYSAWVGAILCGASNRYKLYMSGTRNEPFLQIADYAGHGQDHCELVNPAFTMPNEDDITSGGCTTCEVGDLIDVQNVPVYARAVLGEQFERVTSRFWADLTTSFYSCGVSLSH